jgi:hypothetical protein
MMSALVRACRLEGDDKGMAGTGQGEGRRGESVTRMSVVRMLRGAAVAFVALIVLCEICSRDSREKGTGATSLTWSGVV